MNALTGLHSINIIEFFLLILFDVWKRNNRRQWTVFSDLIDLLMSDMQTVIIGIIATILEVIKKNAKNIF